MQIRCIPFQRRQPHPPVNFIVKRETFTQFQDKSMKIDIGIDEKTRAEIAEGHLEAPR
jgi:hypothetical protein